MNLIKLCCIILSVLTVKVSCIMWTMEPNTRKCLRDELRPHVPVSVQYEISDAPGQSIDCIITDSKGHILGQKQNAQSKGQFTFNVETQDTYEICFVSHAAPNQRGIAQEVSLVAKHGVETKNYDAIAEAANLKPIELELKRLEDLSNAIVEDFALMRKREEEMRDTNESTNNRVLYFSIFSLFCLLGLATWQVLYLRRYFKAKKLIE